MSPFNHSRPTSIATFSTAHSSVPSTAPSYQIILEHLFTYPATFELPLRTVFAQNCEPRKQAKSHRSTSSCSRSSVSSASSANAKDLQRQATADFAALLLSHMAQMPTQPNTLPPAFLAAFIRRCFASELAEVDFPQALTGLDYLRDLEARRRRDHEAALRRLHVSADDLRNPEHFRLKTAHHPGIAAWVRSQERHERTMDTSYTQLYIGLRRWILINELMIQPFNKANCLAMLNTLFPPMTTTPPSSKLTAHQIKAQRDAYFRWITRIETHYKTSAAAPNLVLQPLMVHGKRPGDATAWPTATEDLDIYLRAALRLVDDYALIQSPEDLDVRGNYKTSGGSHASNSTSKKKERKVDSGISFGSAMRPSTSSSLGGATLVGEHPPKSAQHSPTHDAAPEKERSHSTLERLARELRRVRAVRENHITTYIRTLAEEVAEEVEKEKRLAGQGQEHGYGRHDSRSSSDSSAASSAGGHAQAADPRVPRKVRSFSDMKRGLAPTGSGLARTTTLESGAGEAAFDQDEMRRQRALWEANSGTKAGVRA